LQSQKDTYTCHYPPIKKAHTLKRCKPHEIIGSGGRIRTYGLRVMSPTSYQTAPPRDRNVNIASDKLSVNRIFTTDDIILEDPINARYLVEAKLRIVPLEIVKS
jgi:hypothetical protein